MLLTCYFSDITIQKWFKSQITVLKKFDGITLTIFGINPSIHRILRDFDVNFNGNE